MDKQIFDIFAVINARTVIKCPQSEKVVNRKDP